MKEIACIFVNYNNSLKSIECIKSFIKQLDHSYFVRVFIIDNDSVTKEKDILKEFTLDQSSPNVLFEIFFLEKNLGYFPAINHIFTEHLKVMESAEYVIIGNNDLAFSDTFLSILQTRNYPDDVFVVSPNIINSDNNHQNPQIIYKYSRLQLIFLEIYHSTYLVAWFLNFISTFVKFRSSQNSKPGYNKSQYISFGYGACYILTKNYSIKIKSIPSYLFLMNEENALTNSVLENKGRIYYDSELIVHHLEHSSINLAPKRKMYRIVKESYKISKKHFNNKYLFDKQIKGEE